MDSAVAGNTPNVAIVADGAYSLRAKECEIHGGEITFEHEFTNIGYWHGEKDHTTWQVLVAIAGEFDLYFDYGCEPRSDGGPFVFEGGESTLRGRIASTGSCSHYRLVKVGTIKLAAGDVRFTLPRMPKPCVVHSSTSPPGNWCRNGSGRKVHKLERTGIG